MSLTELDIDYHELSGGDRHELIRNHFADLLRLAIATDNLLEAERLYEEAIDMRQVPTEESRLLKIAKANAARHLERIKAKDVQP